MNSSNDKSKEEQLKRLYLLRDQLAKESNALVFKGFGVNESRYQLSQKSQTHQVKKEIVACEKKVGEISDQISGTLSQRIKAVRDSITALEIELYGKPRNSPYFGR